MTLVGWIRLLLCVLVAACARPLGGDLTRVLYGAAGVDPREEPSWLGYALALLALRLAGALLL
jgi:K+-transporting ATPase A subunit